MTTASVQEAQPGRKGMNMNFVTDQLDRDKINRVGMAQLFGGTFEKPERNQTRGDRTLGSTAYIPDVAEEEKRLVANDKLRRFVPLEEVPAEDPSIGSRFVDPDTLSPQPVYDLLKMGGPAYVIRVYEMAGPRGRFDILNRLPHIVAKLKAEGIYCLQAFKETRVGSFSAYRILRGHAAEERKVIGPESGIACQILRILGDYN